MIGHLPHESATFRAVHGDAAAWGATEYLLADLIDVGQWANWQRANEGAKASKQSPRPTPYPRPGHVDDNRTQLDHGAMVRRLRDLARRARRRRPPPPD